MHESKEHKRSELELLRRLPVPRGRILLAVILVTTMLFMWARLLFSGKDDATAAVSAAMQTAPPALSPKPPARLKAVELPVIAGRHDRLTRDVFTTANWRAFRSLKGETAKAPPMEGAGQQDLTEYDIRVIEQNIKLDGIIAGQDDEAREAFINGKLVRTGGQVKIEHKSRPWVLIVVAIHKNKVVLGLENYTLNVAMPQADSLNN